MGWVRILHFATLVAVACAALSSTGCTRARNAEAPAPDAPEIAAQPPSGPVLRVLFVGNSHTYYNDMPKLIAQLAEADGERPLAFELVVRAGAKLMDHVADGKAAARLSSGGFNVLVLQEQQQWPSFGAEQRAREMNAPAQVLSLNSRASGAKTIVVMTWARRAGDPQNVPGDTFEAMHARSVLGNLELARAIGATPAPVALAWKRVFEARPDIALWQPDGSHPSPAGSYLAACVLYQALYGKSPSGNRFLAGLSERDAAFLQEVAATSRADAI